MGESRPQAKRAYHHGNLRHDLVAVALQIINRRGREGLTLRAVAERLGVTAPAVYRHFASKEALLAAVASQGFTILLDECRLATAEAGPHPVDRYEAMAVGYARFAVAHADHFRVMYGRRVDFDDEGLSQRRVAYRMLTSAIEECQNTGHAPRGDVHLIATQAWAHAHGLITLYLDGLLHRSIDGPALVEMARGISAFLLPIGKRHRPAAGTPGGRRRSPK